MLASVAFRSQHHFSLASQLWLTAHDFPPPVSHVIKASREIFVLMCCAADENNQGEDYGAETEQKSVSLDSPNSVGHWKVGWRESLGLWCWSSVKNSVKPLGFGTSKRGSTVQSGGFFIYWHVSSGQDKTQLPHQRVSACPLLLMLLNSPRQNQTTAGNGLWGDQWDRRTGGQQACVWSRGERGISVCTGRLWSGRGCPAVTGHIWPMAHSWTSMSGCQVS